VLKDHCPHLPGEHTREKEVLGRFLFLVAKWASILMRQIPFGEAISSPDVLFDGQPKEEFTPQRGPTFPNASPRMNTGIKSISCGFRF
jgi:hypothetical protein